MFKFKRLQLGSNKTYRGWNISVFLKIHQDQNVLNSTSYYQAELEKGSIVHTLDLNRGLYLLEAYDNIYNKIEQLVEDEKKRA